MRFPLSTSSTLPATLCALALTRALVAPLPAAGDWPSWRGPEGNGIAASSPALLSQLPAAGLKPIWTSEKILSERDGGFGSPVVGDGRVYVYCCWRTRHPVEYRMLREETLSDLGVLRPERLSDASHDKIERARVSMERKSLAADDLDRWMERWSQTNLPDEERAVGSILQYANDRLRRAEQALPVEVLQTLSTIVGRKFDNAAAIDAWAASSGIDPQLWQDAIRTRLPDYERTEEDLLFCIDIRDGRTLWKFARPTRSTKWSSSSTPCVTGDAVLFLGAQGTAYCLDAASGKERWRQPLAGEREGGAGYNSSFAVSGARAFVLLNRLVALDLRSGAIAWERKEARGQNSSPVLWRGPGRVAVIAGESGDRCAFDPETGAPLWRVSAPGQSTPAVRADLMAIQHPKGLVAFRLSPDAATKIAESPKGGSKAGSPTILGNRIFSGSGEGACLDAQSGQVPWSGPRSLDHYSSPALVDGRLWCLGRNQLIALDPDTGKELARAKIDYLKCASPAFAAGHLVVRARAAVHCYDLRATR